jgi:hypothetical protein
VNKKFLLGIMLTGGFLPLAASALTPAVAQVAKVAFIKKDTLMTLAGLGIGGVFYNHLTNTIAQIMPNALQSIYTMQMSLLKKSALFVTPILIISTVGAIEYFHYRMKKRVRA